MSPAPPGDLPCSPLAPQALAFLGDIKEDADDDAPRLIFADWLAEHGTPLEAARGALLRLQCRLHRLAADDPQRSALREQERRLLARHQKEWLGPLYWRVSRWRFVRGLLHLTAAAGRLLSRSPRLTPEALAWVEELTLFDLSGARAKRLARWGPLAHVSGLEARNNDLDSAAAAALGESPLLAGLRSLNLANNRIGPEGAAVLAAAPHLSRLRLLDLAFNPLGREGVAALAASPHLSGLETLVLARTALTDDGARALAAAPHLRRLRLLNVYGNGLGPAATAALEARFGPRVCF
jgi:uncharacterized protein (TIGR02996 family)